MSVQFELVDGFFCCCCWFNWYLVCWLNAFDVLDEVDPSCCDHHSIVLIVMGKCRGSIGLGIRHDAMILVSKRFSQCQCFFAVRPHTMAIKCRLSWIHWSQSAEELICTFRDRPNMPLKLVDFDLERANGNVENWLIPFYKLISLSFSLSSWRWNIKMICKLAGEYLPKTFMRL